MLKHTENVPEPNGSRRNELSYKNYTLDENDEQNVDVHTTRKEQRVNNNSISSNSSNNCKMTKKKVNKRKVNKMKKTVVTK